MCGQVNFIQYDRRPPVILSPAFGGADPCHGTRAHRNASSASGRCRLDRGENRPKGSPQVRMVLTLNQARELENKKGRLMNELIPSAMLIAAGGIGTGPGRLGATVAAVVGLISVVKI